MVFCLTTLMNELLLQIDTRPPYATQTVMQLLHLSDVVVCARAPRDILLMLWGHNVRTQHEGQKASL